MKRPIKFYLKKGLLFKDDTSKSLVNEYLNKAKSNLLTLRILSEIQTDKKFREKLAIPENYTTYEWVVITGYYAMYTSALALLAKIGFRSKNHKATIFVLEEYFIKDKILNDKDLLLMKNAHFQKEEIEKLSDARHKREIAQYSITKQTTKEIAEKIKKDAYSFINKCEEILAG